MRLLYTLSATGALQGASAIPDNVTGLEHDDPNSGAPTLGTSNLDDLSKDASLDGASVRGTGVSGVCGCETATECADSG